MFSRIALLAAAVLATACATKPAATPDAPASPGAAASPAPAGSAGTATVSNMAATTHWLAEEKLIPEDPMMALVNIGARNTDATAGVSVKCRAANGSMTVHVGKQPATRVGQSATFKLRVGPGTQDVPGKFEANARSPDADFVFPVSSADLLAMGQFEMLSMITDQGEVQWALVKNPAATVQAKYVGSLKDFGTAARDFLNYCNPK